MYYFVRVKPFIRHATCKSELASRVCIKYKSYDYVVTQVPPLVVSVFVYLLNL